MIHSELRSENGRENAVDHRGQGGWGGAATLSGVTASPRQLPRQLAVATALVGVQAGVLVVAAVWLAADTVFGSPDDPGAAITLAVLAAAAGLLLGWLARGLTALRLWARTPVVFLEILFLPVGWTLFDSGWVVAAAAYLGLALAVLVLLFTPPAREALEGPTSPR